jgi:hypothetical protein
VASPVFAAPNMGLVAGGTAANGHLDANGNWAWTVQITPDLSLVPDSSGTPVAAELGFTGSSTRSGDITGQGDVLNATNASSGAGDLFDTINPGAVIFSGWQTAGNQLLDANSNNRPTGIQTNCTSGTCSTQSYTTPAILGNDSSVAGSANQIFAALGSINFTTAGVKDYIDISVQRPVVTAGNTLTTTTIKVSGVYGTGGTNGRLTQVTGLSGTTYLTSNFDTFGGNSYSFTMTAKGGDTNLDGSITFADYSTLSGNFEAGAGKKWQDGDFNGDGLVTFADYSILSGNFETTPYTVGPVSPGGGSGLSASSVPEPASIALFGLAVLGSLGLIRRQR